MNEERLSKLEEFLTPEKVEVSDDEIKEIVWYIVLVLKTISREADGILHDIIRLKKCDINYAKNVLRKMKELGLEVCGSYNGYSMRYFGTMRGYIPNDYFEFTGTEDDHWTTEEEEMFAKFEEEIKSFKKKVFKSINQGHPITVKN